MPKITKGGVSNRLVDPDFIAEPGTPVEAAVDEGRPDVGGPSEEQPETHAGYLLDGDILPQDYKYQVHGHLLVTGAPCCWFMSYCPGMRPLLLKIEPDETTEKLRAALEEFHGRLIAALAKVKGA